MGKYDALEGHLRRQRGARYDMTFRDIERVLASLLPKRAAQPAWWLAPAPGGLGSIQSQAWLRAGFIARPDVGAERVRFERPAGAP